MDPISTAIIGIGVDQIENIIRLAGKFRGSGNRRREGAEDIGLVVVRMAKRRKRSVQQLETLKEQIDPAHIVSVMLVYMLGTLLAEMGNDEYELRQAADDLHDKSILTPEETEN